MTLGSSSFRIVQRLVRKASGIVLGEGKEYLVESRLLPLCKTTGCSSIDDLVRRVDGDAKLAAVVVDALTTNETSFLRDLHPFECFCETVVPQLMAARAGERRLRIWSAACSTGQEPYTLSMLLADRFPELADWDVKILATDISERVLEKARSGRFSQLEVNRGLPAKLMVKNFKRIGTEWQARPELARCIEFRQLNLVERWSGMEQYDVVLLRNVMIYFDVETKAAVLGKVRSAMRDGGWLLLGAAETTTGLSEDFERDSGTESLFYRATSRGALPCR
ncbi:MAG: CheR family methyltransferase [Planctomycetota bacterium]